MNFKNLFKWLEPAPYLPEITDQDTVKKQYKYWRIRIFYSMYTGYLLYYFTRKSFTVIKPYLCSELNFTLGELGLVSTLLAISYGVSKFASGVLSDRSNPRYFMAIGLLLTGVCNIFFGFSNSMLVFGLLWGLNGWFQGWGWPSCTKQLTHWYSHAERGTWWSICTTSHTAGGLLVALVAGYSAKWFGWRTGMMVPGVICIVAALWLLNRLRDVPQSLGLPSIEKFKGEKITKNDKHEVLSVKRILFEQVLNNKYIWLLAISYFFIYVIRCAIDEWCGLYLVEMKGFTKIAGSTMLFWFEVGGFFGILLAGWGSDNWFSGKRAPLIILSSFGLIFSIMALWYLKSDQFYVACLLVALIGFLVFGPQMLVGLAAAEFVDKKAASTSNGFVGCFASLGMAVAGYPIGKLTEVWGWFGFVVVLVLCSLCAFLILLPLWSIRKEDAQSASTERDVIPELRTA